MSHTQGNIAELENWLRTQGMAEMDPEALCKDPAVLKMVLKDLNNEGKAGKLGKNEGLAAVLIISGLGSQTVGEVNSPWTADNGFLTASNKLQRNTVLKGLETVMADLKQKGIK